jgi:tRNA G46 methylase TrmB
MGLKNKRRESNKLGPFRGPTPPNVFQTVDVGTGKGDHIRRQAEQFKGRKYVAVDPLYSLSRTQSELDNPSRAARSVEGAVELSRIRRVTQGVNELVMSGVTVYPKAILDIVTHMRQAGLKTRHFNIDMPNDQLDKHCRRYDFYEYEKWFKQLPSVLFPNGKIFVTSESEATLREIEESAKQAGLKTRRRPNLSHSIPLDKLRTGSMRVYVQKGNEIKRLEITFGLKKAIPDKKQRRNWPRRDSGFYRTQRVCRYFCPIPNHRFRQSAEENGFNML